MPFVKDIQLIIECRSCTHSIGAVPISWRKVAKWASFGSATTVLFITGENYLCRCASSNMEKFPLKEANRTYSVANTRAGVKTVCMNHSRFDAELLLD